MSKPGCEDKSFPFPLKPLAGLVGVGKVTGHGILWLQRKLQGGGVLLESWQGSSILFSFQKEADMEACCLLLHPGLLHPCLLHPCLHSIAFASECQSWWTFLSQGSRQRDPCLLSSWLMYCCFLEWLADRDNKEKHVTGWAWQQRETLSQVGLDSKEKHYHRLGWTAKRNIFAGWAWGLRMAGSSWNLSTQRTISRLHNSCCVSEPISQLVLTAQEPCLPVLAIRIGLEEPIWTLHRVRCVFLPSDWVVMWILMTTALERNIARQTCDSKSPGICRGRHVGIGITSQLQRTEPGVEFTMPGEQVDTWVQLHLWVASFALKLSPQTSKMPEVF